MSIENSSLTEVSKTEVIELMNHPKVRQHMPLLDGKFDDAQYDLFIAAKKKIWEDHGYGPWAFKLEGKFVGWGGLQPVGEDVEIALVLHPDFWGLGKTLYQRIIDFAFQERNFESVIILFPPTRTRIKAIFKLGFQPDGEYSFAGHRYLRYRLQRSSEPS